jgi:hypothetical protein
MYCMHCGSALNEETRFCGKCGQPTKKPQPRRGLKIILLLLLIAVYLIGLTVYRANRSDPQQRRKAPEVAERKQLEEKRKEHQAIERQAQAKREQERIEETSQTLEASASCAAGRVVVRNEGTEHWWEIKISVNEGILDSGYTHTVDGMMAGTTYRFLPEIFTDSKAERLDLNRVVCKSISIHANTESGRRHWFGSR